MKNLNIAKGLLLLLIILASACSDMNDMHDVYLKDGEKIYVGRIDSLKSFAGNERLLLQYWTTDPRVKSLHILWNQKRDSIVVQVPKHDPADPVEVIIGEGNSMITEGDHSFFIYSYDSKGHRSIVFETLVSVYGERYQASLTNRPVKNIDVIDDNKLSIKWAGSVSMDEVGVQISYSNKNNNQKKTFISTEILESPVVFDDIDLTKSISYRTMYLPKGTAIDTFYTNVAEPIKVKIIKNVVLNKPTTVSDMLNSNFPDSNAVDGVISNASRWVSSATGEHWIEVDLEESYPIQSFKSYNGSGDTPNMAIKNFMFQVNINGEWITIVNVTNNSNHSYGATFEEIVTDKVRFFVPEYADNQVRLYELEVFYIV